MLTLNFLLKVSRPRFWFYVLGPFLIGIVSAITSLHQLQSWKVLCFGIYFLLPANLLIYGINDIFDYETDRLNEKKKEYEILVTPSKHKVLLISIAVTNLPFFIVSIFFFPSSLLSLVGFLFFSIFYSAPPIRAKTTPVLDSAFNILYIFPAILGYKLMLGVFPPIIAIIAAGFWTAAMHAYSAIPDIEADRTASISTVATLLGAHGTHIFCLILYTAAAILSVKFIGILGILSGFVYVFTILVSLYFVNSKRLFAVYRAFPLINIAAGFVLFWYIVLTQHFKAI